MSLTSAFKSPDASIMTGLAEAAIVIGIYTHNLPTGANVRANPLPNDKTLESMRKAAAMEALGVIGVTFLLTRDWNSFVIAGLTLGGIDIWMKMHNATDPASNKATGAVVTTGIVQPEPESGYTAVQYTDEDAMDYAS
jgi:hypothetical protein